ncbi:MAG: glycoside hydrolase family 88 protein [Bacteroidota bacterium]
MYKELSRLLQPFCYLICTFCCFNNFSQTLEETENVIRAIADKVIDETSFEEKRKGLSGLNGWTPLLSPAAPPGHGYFGYCQIQVSSDLPSDEVFLGISYKGSISIFLDQVLIFEGENETFDISEYAYGMFKMNEELPVQLGPGIHEVIVHIRGCGEESNVFIMPLSAERVAVKEISPLPGITVPYDAQWLITGPLPSESSIASIAKTISPAFQTIPVPAQAKQWKVPALPVVQELVVKEDNSFKHDSYADWHYANGGTMLGILNVYEATGDGQYLDFVSNYAHNICDKRPMFQHQYQEVGEVRGSYHRLFRMTMLDDSGGPAIPFAQLALLDSAYSHDAILQPVLEYVSKGQVRLSDGTFCRPEPEEYTIWSDDLFMSVPFLCRMAVLRDDPLLFDDVVNQIVQFNKYLEDPRTGLYFHGWFASRNEPSIARWSRANGWATWAMSEALLNLPQDHPAYDQVKGIYARHIESIINYQASSGMWHQILDVPTTYEETSSTAMFTLSVARGVINGWLDPNLSDVALCGWRAILNKVEKDGTVKGICRGTGIGNSVEFYNARQTFDHDPRGLGAVLTAGVSIHELLQHELPKN